MATTPPHDEPEPDQRPGQAELGHGGDTSPAQRWIGRARVGARATATPPAIGAPSYGSTAPARPASVPGRRRIRPRWGRIALVAVLALALLAGIAVLGGYLWLRSVDGGLKRTDAFADVAGRPPKMVDGAMNLLLLGSDSRDPDAPIDRAGVWRTDTILLVHIPASHDKAYVISLPRDLWVHVPASKDGRYGNSMAKINAAYAWGGAPLMVQTVEEFTGVRLDHVALIDFGGFVRVTDALGGVDMNVERTITSIHKPHRTFPKGMNHFNGTEALDYVRQRYQFPDGDFARIRHQQQFLKAILDKAVSAGTLGNPATFAHFVSSVADAMTVDKDFSLLDLGWQFHSLRSNDLVFLTSPYVGTSTIDGQSVVVSDHDKALGLYDAVAKDTLAAWLPKPSAPARAGG
jgi:LCP family protein required for cell wall assembly